MSSEYSEDFTGRSDGKVEQDRRKNNTKICMKKTFT
jgi:hypothetical protein